MNDRVLDPDAARLLEIIAMVDAAPLETMTPAAARESYAALAAMSAGLPVDGIHVEQIVVADIPCVLARTPACDGERGLLVWIHGGGWVIGSADQTIPLITALAARARCDVLSIDYSLAPEHPFPIALDECEQVVRWAIEHGHDLAWDPARVAVGGDSAGGNLSAVLANEVPGLAYQVLIYPATDALDQSGSLVENADGYLLTASTMEWFGANYVRIDHRDDPRVSPLRADDDVLEGSCPALVLTAGFDPLRDQGQAYAARLASLGVETETVHYEHQIHGFFTMAAVIGEGAEAVELVGARLAERIGC